MFENATVTLTLGQIQAFEADKKALETALFAARAEVDKARLEDPEGRVAVLRDLVDNMLDIVRFAVGNLHPLTVRGLPFRSLRKVIDGLRKIPGKVLPDDLLHALEYAFTGWEKWELAREAGIEQQLHAEENATKAVSPALLRGLGLLGPELPAGPVDLGMLPTPEQVYERTQHAAGTSPAVQVGTPDPA